MMKFISPSKKHEEKVKDYVREFHEHNSEIFGSRSLDRFIKENKYNEWLMLLQADLDIANMPKNQVPRCTYFYVREDDDKIIGVINIRLTLNNLFRKEGGHIGYSIRPTERRKGYATRMLQETLVFCGAIGLSEIIITCDKSNLASAGVIQKCGGVLEEEFNSDTYEGVVQRYIIKRD